MRATTPEQLMELLDGLYANGADRTSRGQRSSGTGCSGKRATPWCRTSRTRAWSPGSQSGCWGASHAARHSMWDVASAATAAGSRHRDSK